MSRTKNDGHRCDWCGKITRSDRCEYVIDGRANYIHQPEWERFKGIQSNNDICEQCAEKHCPECGSEKLNGSDTDNRCMSCGCEWPRKTEDT